MGAKVGCVRRAVAGYVRAMFALCSRYVRAMSARDRNGRRVQSSRRGKQCAAYYWGMPLQIARRLITVGARWRWVAIKSVVVKTAQVWTQSKFAREMLCFTIETAVGGREGRMCPTGGCGLCPRYVRAMFALCPHYVRAMFARDPNGRRVQSSRKGKQCAAYYWGMPLQIARRLIMVGARWRWVAIGAAVLLGNATADC